MTAPDATYIEAATVPRRIVKYALQPAVLVFALWLWLSYRETLPVELIALLGLHVLLGILEAVIPARPGWRIRGKELFGNIGMVVILLTAAGLVTVLYDTWLREPLADLRTSLGLDIWPHEWPVLVQLFMVFFASEFIWYWVHRAEHRWSIVWRVSGHGAHHSFKKLGALNFGLNHPLELFLIALPAALVELTFGVGPAAAGAAMLVVLQASLAHSNLDLNSRVIGWLFTTNRHHIMHHSMVLDESNTNYGCSAIVWDRVFGTFRDERSVEAGTGPTEPTVVQKLLMPFREPADTAIAP